MRYIYPDPRHQQPLIIDIWAVVFGGFIAQLHNSIHLIQSTCVILLCVKLRNWE